MIKNKQRNRFLGFAAIVLGLLLLLPMLSGTSLRQQISEQVQNVAQSAEYQSTRFEQHHRADFHPHRGRGGFSLFHAIGNLIKLIALGAAAFLLFRYIQDRRAASDEHVEVDIRVGDEIDDEPKARAETYVDPEEMSVDDLVAAMKRLGIKRLEL